MRQLRFVRSADDANFVIVETADGGEQFLLLVDTALRDAARSDLPRLTSTAPTPEPSISPREIQMQVRAGASPRDIAEAHEMTLERVLRFAGPVLDERSRIADEARRARARRSTTEGQSVVFGEAVNERFAAHGIDPAAVRWDARRRDDGQWIISAGWHGGDADRVADWALNLSTRSVTPLDDTAADLLSDRPIRPIMRAVDVAVRPSLAAAPPLALGVVAFPVMPDAHTGPLPRPDDVYDQEATDPDAPRPGESGGAPHRAPTAVPVADEYDPLPLPLNLPALEAEQGRLPSVKNLGIAHALRSEESDDERAVRARIPSWDDIMLGVRRKSD